MLTDKNVLVAIFFPRKFKMSSRRRNPDFQNDFGSWSTEDDSQKEITNATNGLLEVLRHIHEYSPADLVDLYAIVRETDAILQQKVGYKTRLQRR